jgi:hypothetical protein
VLHVGGLWPIESRVVLLSGEGRVLAEETTTVRPGQTTEVTLVMAADRVVLVLSGCDLQAPRRLALLHRGSGKRFRCTVEPGTDLRLIGLEAGSWDLVSLGRTDGEEAERWELSLQPGREFRWVWPKSR